MGERGGARDAVILLVEDSEPDIELTKIALRQGRVANDLHVVNDGEAALAWLRREPPYEDRPRPHLILLDLNLPKLDGREVLRGIRADPNLTHLPVIVLTTSSAESDVVASYRDHVNAYVTKPVDVDDFIAAIRSLEEFWFSIVLLPEP